jgi:hypothetical protein
MITPEEEKQFLDFGCSSRCLIKFSELAGRPIKRDDFITAYRSFFPPNKCGGLTTSSLIEVGMKMELFTVACAVRRKEKVKKALHSEGANSAFVFTDWNQAPDGVWGEVYHTQLLLGFDPKGQWVVFHPNPDGRDMDIHYSDQELDERFAHFLLIY